MEKCGWGDFSRGGGHPAFRGRLKGGDCLEMLPLKGVFVVETCILKGLGDEVGTRNRSKINQILPFKSFKNRSKHNVKMGLGGGRRPSWGGLGPPGGGLGLAWGALAPKSGNISPPGEAYRKLGATLGRLGALGPFYLSKGLPDG